MTRFQHENSIEAENSVEYMGQLLLPILIALIFLAFTFSYYPFREKIQFDSDEGLKFDAVHAGRPRSSVVQ